MSQEKVIHYVLLGVLLIYTVVILFAEFFLPDEKVWCKYYAIHNTKEYEKPQTTTKTYVVISILYTFCT
jgi:hypothetical protein